MGELQFRGRRLMIGRYAEIHFAPAWRYNGAIRRGVQSLLNGIDDWDPAETDIVVETIDLSGITFANPTVSIPFPGQEPERFFWAVHSHHTARQPGCSPFAQLYGRPDRTNLLTIELAGSPDKPVLARLYPGDEMMPLPWQTSVRKSGSATDRNESQAYWRTHAFVAMDNYRLDTVTAQLPSWYANS